jgi:hypothetical protein
MATKTEIKQRKMKYFVHIKRHDGLEKIIEGYTPENRRKLTKKNMGSEHHRQFANK